MVGLGFGLLSKAVVVMEKERYFGSVPFPSLL